MEYVSLNIKGKAESWYECSVWEKRGSFAVTWDKFCVDICRRFCDEPTDLMARFTSVKQTEDMSVHEYTEKFEEALSSVVSAYPNLQKAFYVTSFIRGLKLDINSIIGIETPATISDAFQLAKQQEKYLTDQEQRYMH